MNLIIQPIDTNYVSQAWPLVEKFIADALVKGGQEEDANYTLAHVQVYLTTGAWLLIVATDEQGMVHGAATVSFLNYPLHRVAFITTIGGKLITNEDTFAQFSNLLRQRGATKIQGFTRESVIKLSAKYGFKPITTLVEVKI